MHSTTVSESSAVALSEAVTFFDGRLMRTPPTQYGSSAPRLARSSRAGPGDRVHCNRVSSRSSLRVGMRSTQAVFCWPSMRT